MSKYLLSNITTDKFNKRVFWFHTELWCKHSNTYRLFLLAIYENQIRRVNYNFICDDHCIFCDDLTRQTIRSAPLQNINIYVCDNCNKKFSDNLKPRDLLIYEITVGAQFKFGMNESFSELKIGYDMTYDVYKYLYFATLIKSELNQFLREVVTIIIHALIELNLARLI